MSSATHHYPEESGYLRAPWNQVSYDEFNPFCIEEDDETPRQTFFPTNDTPQDIMSSRRSSLNVAAAPFKPLKPLPLVDEHYPSTPVTSTIGYESRRKSFCVPEGLPLAAWTAQQERLNAHLAACTPPEAHQSQDYMLDYQAPIEWNFGLQSPKTANLTSFFTIQVPLVHLPQMHAAISPPDQPSGYVYYDEMGLGFPSSLSTPFMPRFPVTPSPNLHTQFAPIDIEMMMMPDPFYENTSLPTNTIQHRRSSVSEALQAGDDPAVDHLADLSQLMDVRLLSGRLNEMSMRRSPEVNSEDSWSEKGTLSNGSGSPLSEGSPQIIWSSRTPPMTHRFLDTYGTPGTVCDSPISTPNFSPVDAGEVAIAEDMYLPGVFSSLLPPGFFHSNKVEYVEY